MLGLAMTNYLSRATQEWIAELDDGIRDAVVVLQDAGIETIESCQGGAGHAFPDPTIRFGGNNVEGFRAFAAAITHGLRVYSLRRVYDVVENELSGPWWEIIFRQEPRKS